MKISCSIPLEGGVLKLGEKSLTLWNWFVFSIIDEKTTRKVQIVPLSNNSIYRIILDCVANKLYELFREMKLSESFTIQLNKSADVVRLAFVFVRPVYDNKFQEDLLLCKLSEARATGLGIIWILDQLVYRPLNWIEQMHWFFFTDSETPW
jgi:hypothetical protein